MKSLDSVLALAREGHRFFPVIPNGKKPAVKNWQKQATCDEEKIRSWFGEGGRFADHNVGMRGGTTRINPATGETEHLAIVDIDMKNGKDGERTLIEACKAIGLNVAEHIETRIQKTPSGGEHLLYWSPVPIKQGADVIGAGVDTRSDAGFIVVTPSMIDGKPYCWANTLPIAPLGRLAELFTVAGESKPVDTTPLDGVDPKRAEKRAIEYLATAPIAVEGSAGDGATYKVAAKLKDRGCTEAQTLDLMLEHWNERCSPPWQPNDLAKKVANAYKHGKNAPGIAAPEAVFPAVERDGTSEDAEINPLAKLNKEYAFIKRGALILCETKDASGALDTRFMTRAELFGNVPFQTGKSRPRPISEHWLEWTGRRQYEDVVFRPAQTTPPQFYNLWRGFGIEPKKGNWSRMRSHIRDVVCSSNEQHFSYLMGWMARAVQRPWELGEVAVVLRGPQGAGKGTLAQWLKQIFGSRHGTQVTHSEHLVGKFNAHLMQCAFLFADEAFFAGDRKHVGVLKALITERKFMLERKGQDAVEADNCLHVLMASNDDWVIPAAADERRYFVLDVSAKHLKDHVYFEALANECGSGGIEAMLFDLLSYNLETFNVRSVPTSGALDDQKVASMSTPARWLVDLLQGETLSNGMGRGVAA